MTVRPSVDFLLYAMHVAYWSTFGVTLMFQRSRPDAADPAPAAPAAQEAKTARE